MAEVVKGAIYDVGSNNMVIVRNIEVHSMCEHHMFPFHGKVKLTQLSYIMNMNNNNRVYQNLFKIESVFG